MLLTLLWPCVTQAQLVICDADAARVAAALEQIRRSVDPCGESAEVAQTLAQLERCTSARYEICTSVEISRNVFDRPSAPGAAMFRTIAWNPELRTELEGRCDGDPTQPVRRDPTASLLHELVHAAQDCAGRNPGEHEFEAVRIENIYRRAAGLCQRSGYGEDALPRDMVRVCRAGDCPCSLPPEADGVAQNREPSVSIHADGEISR